MYRVAGRDAIAFRLGHRNICVSPFRLICLNGGGKVNGIGPQTFVPHFERGSVGVEAPYPKCGLLKSVILLSYWWLSWFCDER